MNHLITPLMREVHSGRRVRSLVAVEHFAANVVSTFLKHRLDSSTQLLAGNPTLAFATLEGQQHGLGSLMAANVALDEGFPWLEPWN